MEWKNRCIYPWMRLLRSDSWTTTNRFLIISTTGLGDALWGTPALRILKTHFPDAYIGVLTNHLGAQVFSTSPHIDEIFLLRNSSALAWARQISLLKKRKIDTALLFHTSQRFAIPLCHIIGVSRTVAISGASKGWDHFVTHLLPTKPEHKTEERIRIVETIGATSFPCDPSLILTEKDQEEAASFCQRTGLTPNQFIGIHPGAKNTFKQWPPSYFIALGKHLAAHTSYPFVISGDPSEKQLITEISRSIPRAIPMCGALSVRGFAALLAQMPLFITGDTGPMHLACTMNTPTCALFSPTDPASCKGLGNPNLTILSRPPTCAPCLKKKCREPFCLMQISVNEVLEKALALLYLQTNSLQERSLCTPSSPSMI